MARIVLYLIMLVQFLGAAIAFYHLDPKVLLGSISLENGMFLGLFFLIHLLGLAGAVLVVLGRRSGLTLSLAHQLLMLVGVKIGTTFVFITHDVVSFFVFVVRSFGEFGWTYRWSIGLDTIIAQIAANTRVSYIGVNVVALGCAAYLWWALKVAGEDDETETPIQVEQRPAPHAPMDGRQQRRVS